LRVVPTTSRPRRSRPRDASPLKSIRLTVTLPSSSHADLRRLAEEKGVRVEEKGGRISLVFKAETAEEALAQLGVISSLLIPKA
jgi:hypothetical protein